MLACAPSGSNANATPACAKQAADIAAEALYITPRTRHAPGFWRWRKAVSDLGGPGISSDGLDPRRRRLLFRSWHRGIREMDIVYGQFADAQIALLSDLDLDTYEQLLELPDQQVFEWVTGAQELPADYDTSLFRRLLEFYSGGTLIK
jgi:antitoxin CptB